MPRPGARRWAPRFAGEPARAPRGDRDGTVAERVVSGGDRRHVSSHRPCWRRAGTKLRPVVRRRPCARRAHAARPDARTDRQEAVEAYDEGESVRKAHLRQVQDRPPARGGAGDLHQREAQAEAGVDLSFGVLRSRFWVRVQVHTKDWAPNREWRTQQRTLNTNWAPGTEK
jgi:hypothetical protein